MSVSDAAAVESAAGGTEQGETQAGLDLSPLTERLEQGLGELRSEIASLRPVEAAEAETPTDPWAQEFAGLFGEEEITPEEQQLDARQLVQAIQAASQTQTQQALAPVMEQMQRLQGELDAQALIKEFPELEDSAVASKAVEAATELAQQMGVPQLGRSAALVRVAYLAAKAEGAAQSEVPAGGEHVGLESAAGGAGQAAQETDEAQRIVNAGGGSRKWF